MKLKKLNKTEQKVYEKALEVAAEAGCKLWDVEYIKEGAEWYLRILVDKDTGVDISDCEKITKPIDKWLDKEDFIDNSYILEVGSAGLFRKLKRFEHFELSLGKKVTVKEHQNEHTGFLNAFSEEKITLNDTEFPLEDITDIRIFDEV